MYYRTVHFVLSFWVETNLFRFFVCYICIAAGDPIGMVVNSLVLSHLYVCPLRIYGGPFWLVCWIIRVQFLLLIDIGEIVDIPCLNFIVFHAQQHSYVLLICLHKLNLLVCKIVMNIAAFLFTLSIQAINQ